MHAVFEEELKRYLVSSKYVVCFTFLVFGFLLEVFVMLERDGIDSCLNTTCGFLEGQRLPLPLSSGIQEAASRRRAVMWSGWVSETHD